ncbi:MAG: serine/threonine-protein kinase [Treponema sp.]|nr:serine/threonine-protein kinase [Treponema sp.]
MELKDGESIGLEGGKTAKIVSRLGEGGQGIVYAVKIDGKDYALKWYTHTSRLQDKDAFKTNLQENIKKGAPDNKFLWPLYLTEEKEGCFGYVMDLRPKGFSEFSDILNNKVRFPSTDVLVTSALNIVNAFRSLHREGLSYQDLNDGNFFINVNTGDVLICDNDNVTPDGKQNPGNIMGKPGYMAPEIVRDGKRFHPNSLTDNHSLAVILFKLFCRHDPLMGKAYVESVCITEKREWELYGQSPVFIFDPLNDSNRPVPGVHPNPIKLWPRYPKFIREAFEKSFCEGMKNPNARLDDNHWQQLLIRFRGTILKCPHCSAELSLALVPHGNTLKFDCGRSYSYPFALDDGRHKTPLFPGSKLYACLTSKDVDDYTTVTGEVIMNKNNPSLWGIKNLSDATWSFFTNTGELKSIEKGSVIPIATDLEIKFDGITAKVSR